MWDWYQDRGTRSQAVRGVPCRRPPRVLAGVLMSNGWVGLTVPPAAVEVDLCMVRGIVGDLD